MGNNEFEMTKTIGNDAGYLLTVAILETSIKHKLNTSFIILFKI